MKEQLQNLRNYFNTGATKKYLFRIEQLKKISFALKKYEKEILIALHTDLGKCEAEAYASEIAIVQNEIKFFIKQLKRLMQPKEVSTNLMNLPGKSKIYYEPLGIVLIIAPWNYPFQLAFNPLVGAIAAGNCVVVKPSEFANATSLIMEKIVKEIFSEDYIYLVQGDGAQIVPTIIEEGSINHVFYTGSTSVGKLIYEMAAKKLIPVTLELGGKSPCVIEDDANLKIAAKRVVIGKFINAGQTCIAPDYLLIHKNIKAKFLEILISTIQSFYTNNAALSKDYGKIINEKRFNTLISFLQQGKIIYGGKYDKESLYIEPTIMQEIPTNAPINHEEIFGPILPIFVFETQSEALEIIRQNATPLAFYIFTSSTTKEDNWINAIPFGGGCINNTAYHFTNHHLPFGGIGLSGIGSYHGKKSFYTFTHAKPVLKSSTWFDPNIKYPPFKGKLRWLKMILKL